jgi:hypothetical protein
MGRDIADEILASAGAEHSARHGEVVEFPLRSAFLKNTVAKRLDGAEAPAPVAWLMWGIMGLCAVMGILFRDAIVAGASYLILQHHERQLAVIGAEICTRPLMTVVEAPCTSGDLACFTEPQQALLKRYEEQARGHNKWQAERCLPLMP